MTQANDSILVTPGSGATVATHLANAKEHQVIMEADALGHVWGTRDTYIAYAPPVSVVGASKFHFDFWNGHASLNAYVHWLSFFCDIDVAVVGALGIRMDMRRTTAIGTAGTALATEPTTIVRGFARVDPAMAALPATITMREIPTGGGTAGVYLGSSYFFPEESATGVASYLAQWQNVLLPLTQAEMPTLKVPFGTGLRFDQGPVASLGKVGVRMIFSLA